MNDLFYYLLVFLGAVFLFLGLSWVLSQGLKRVLLKEYLKIKAEYRTRERGLGLLLSSTAAFLFFLGIFLSWLFTGRLIWGLGLVPLSPYVFRWLIRLRYWKRRESLEASTLSFFYALSGLINVGKNLPTALMELSRSLDSPFSLAFAKHLHTYEEGRGLAHILSRFQYREGLELTGVYIALLELAYRNGLAVGPLLERVIPSLESEREHKMRVSSLRHSIFVQAGVVFCIPWILALSFFVLNPEVFNSFCLNSYCVWVALVALFIELIGIGVLWKISAFY